jgi:hypothetical protein
MADRETLHEYWSTGAGSMPLRDVKNVRPVTDGSDIPGNQWDLNGKRYVTVSKDGGDIFVSEVKPPPLPKSIHISMITVFVCLYIMDLVGFGPIGIALLVPLVFSYRMVVAKVTTARGEKYFRNTPPPPKILSREELDAQLLKLSQPDEDRTTEPAPIPLPDLLRDRAWKRWNDEIRTCIEIGEKTEKAKGPDGRDKTWYTFSDYEPSRLDRSGDKNELQRKIRAGEGLLRSSRGFHSVNGDRMRVERQVKEWCQLLAHRGLMESTTTPHENDGNIDHALDAVAQLRRTIKNMGGTERSHSACIEFEQRITQLHRQIGNYLRNGEKPNVYLRLEEPTVPNLDRPFTLDTDCQEGHYGPHPIREILDTDTGRRVRRECQWCPSQWTDLA